MNQLQQLHAVPAVVSDAGDFMPLAHCQMTSRTSRTFRVFQQPARAGLEAPVEGP